MMVPRPERGRQDRSREEPSGPSPAPFESASVVLPVINETASLSATVDILVPDLGRALKELIIVCAPRTTAASREVIERIAGNPDVAVVVHEQQLPFLGGAIREAFALARGSHVVMMASDLETDPAVVKSMVAVSRQHPGAIVTASRWVGGAHFEDYGRARLLCNMLFQRAAALLYGRHLSDLTYGFRLFPTALVQSIEWRELRHPFLLETIVAPLRLGVPVIEVPARWRSRNEGQSSNTRFSGVSYGRVAITTRFVPRKSLCRSTTGGRKPGEVVGGAEKVATAWTKPGHPPSSGYRQA